MRVLLDENFPDPPGFDPSALDGDLDVVSLRAFDAALINARIPDWYIYLRAHEARFDAIVTRDWHQSAQTEEMWVLSRTDLSVVTWRKPQDDPVVEWAQLLAYLPELRRMLDALGPSVFFLPAARLTVEQIAKATDKLGEMASQLGVSVQEVRRAAHVSTTGWLEERDALSRFADVLDA